MQKFPDQYLYHFFSILALLLVAFFVVRTLTPFGVATTPDSISYLDIAYNFQKTKRLAQSDFSLESYQYSKVVPQRTWPPGYAVLLSFIISDAFDVINISKTSMFLMFVTGFLTLILFRKGKINRSSSLIFSILSMLTLPLVVIYSYAWSETLFIPILLGIILLFWLFLENQNSPVRIRFLIIVTISTLAIFLTMTRYIGIFICLLFPLVYILGNRTRSNFILIVSGGLIYILFVGSFLWGNYKLTGSLSGTHRVSSNLAVFDNMTQTLESLSTIFPAHWVGFSIAGIVSSVYLFAFMKPSRPWSGSMPIDTRVKFVTLLLSVSFLYLFTLILLRSYSQFDQIDVRLIAPSIPPILVALACIPAFFSSKKAVYSTLSFLSFFIFFSLVVRGSECLYSASINWAEKGMPLLPMRDGLTYNNLTRPEIAASKPIVPPGAKLVVDRPLTWRFITRSDTIQKPSQFNDEKLELLNKLPSGSAIILLEQEILLLESATRRHGWTINPVNMGNMVLVRLPFNTK